MNGILQTHNPDQKEPQSISPGSDRYETAASSAITSSSLTCGKDWYNRPTA